MDVNMIGLAVGKLEAEKRGVEPPESTRIGVVSSLMGNPLMSLVISRSMADKEVADAQPEVTTTPSAPGSGTPNPTTPDVKEAVAEAVRPLADTLQKIQTTLEDIQSRMKP